jgi:hypothetical protein
MVLGFMAFWPLGLAMLAYILWGDRFEDWKGNARQFAGGHKHGCNWGRNGGFNARSGNAVFDDWRDAEMRRIEEERRKLDEMRQQFDEYLRELRRAKDQEDFNAFMARRNRPESGDAS